MLQGKESAEYKLKSVARKNNGDGENLSAVAHIMSFDINKVLADIALAIKRGAVVRETFEEEEEDRDE